MIGKLLLFFSALCLSLTAGRAFSIWLAENPLPRRRVSAHDREQSPGELSVPQRHK